MIQPGLLSRAIFALTGRYYHYKIKFVYRPKNNKTGDSCSRYVNVWVKDKRVICDERQLKKSVDEVIFQGIPKGMLNGGRFCIEEIYYIGWFRPIK